MNDRVLGGLAWVAFAHALIVRAHALDRIIHSHPFAPPIWVALTVITCHKYSLARR
jgi:hypothetical protein